MNYASLGCTLTGGYGQGISQPNPHTLFCTHPSRLFFLHPNQSDDTITLTLISKQWRTFIITNYSECYYTFFMFNLPKLSAPLQQIILIDHLSGDLHINNIVS